jgi:hypothetical protein
MRLPRRRSVAAVLVAATALLTVVALRYEARPFFAGDFQPLGPGFLPGWEWNRMVSVTPDQCVYFDRRDRTLLVVAVEANSNVEWVVDVQPVGERLRIRRQDDNATAMLEWRRDCVIFVDRAGTPTYASLPVGEFQQALADPAKMQPGIARIVAEAAPAAARRRAVTGPSSRVAKESHADDL